MAYLDRDLLFEIADKLVCDQDVVSAENRAQFFKIMGLMFVSRSCMSAFLSQFSAVKDYLFDHIQRKPIIQSSLISPDRQVMKCNLQVEGDELLLTMLIRNCKFKPKNLEFCRSNFVSKKNNLASLHEVSSMECFSILLGLDALGLKLNDYRGPELLLDCVRDEFYNINFKNLDLILGLNAKEVWLETCHYEFPSLPEIIDYSPVEAIRTESVTLGFFWNYWRHYRDFPTSTCLKLLSYVMSSCVNLKRLRILFEIDANECGFSTNFYDALLNAMEAMREYVLPPLLKHGCFLQVECRTGYDNAAFEMVQSSSHKLLQWGVREQCDVPSAIRRLVSLDTRAELSFRMSWLRVWI